MASDSCRCFGKRLRDTVPFVNKCVRFSFHAVKHRGFVGARTNPRSHTHTHTHLYYIRLNGEEKEKSIRCKRRFSFCKLIKLTIHIHDDDDEACNCINAYIYYCKVFEKS